MLCLREVVRSFALRAVCQGGLDFLREAVPHYVIGCLKSVSKFILGNVLRQKNPALVKIRSFGANSRLDEHFGGFDAVGLD